MRILLKLVLACAIAFAALWLVSSGSYIHALYVRSGGNCGGQAAGVS